MKLRKLRPIFEKRVFVLTATASFLFLWDFHVHATAVENGLPKATHSLPAASCQGNDAMPSFALD